MLKLLWIAGLVLAASLVAAGTHAAVILSGSFTADNYVYVYLSTSANDRGTLIGSGNNWASTFYVTPASLTPGTTYYLNIEAINGDGGAYSAGGLLGDFTLSGGATFGNGQTELLTSASSIWKAGYNDSNGNNTAQTWLRPTGSAVALGLNGTSPWGTIGGISNQAAWIWASDIQSGNGSSPGSQCASCTVDFQTSFTVAAVPEPGSVAAFGVGLAGLALVLRRRRSRGAV